MSEANIEFVEVMSMRDRQQGSFIIEFCIVLVSLSGIFSMAVSHMIAINYKGQLDRAAYSLATIVAERKQLFDGKLSLNVGSMSANNDMKNIVSSSMKRMNQSFNPDKLAMRVDVYYLDKQSDRGQKKFKLEHKVISTSDPRLFPDKFKLTQEQAENFLPFTNLGRYLPLYRVTLTYQIPFDLIGAINGEMYQVVSSAYTFGRL
ncbi:pilus assembly protein TadF [Vibrio pectenicida]|uniref:Pilus assembly protein TadF n=2 Tax=Vibrio pectenicida TaxID=62763 RepID=A0A7Y4EE89_9VIBR|nr:pilus assembly protein TadF [Vibrio pectenicida]